jgi:hypothetical protein
MCYALAVSKSTIAPLIMALLKLSIEDLGFDLDVLKLQIGVDSWDFEMGYLQHTIKIGRWGEPVKVGPRIHKGQCKGEGRRKAMFKKELARPYWEIQTRFALAEAIKKRDPGTPEFSLGLTIKMLEWTDRIEHIKGEA